MDHVEHQGTTERTGEAKVVTLCGSTRFEADFAEVNRRLTLQGCVVLSLGVYVVDPGGYVGESTRGEIAYAQSLGTPVRYLSREHPDRPDEGHRA